MKRGVKISGLVLLLVLISGFFVFKFPNQAKADVQDELDEIQKQIASQESKIKELEQKEDYYRDSIAAKRKEIISLQGELSILEENREKILVSIEQTETQIEKTELEIVNIKLKIEQKEEEISVEKSKMEEIIKLIYWSDQKSLLEIILTNESLADFFNHIKYSQDLQRDLSKSLDSLEATHQGLKVENEDLEDKKDNLGDLKIALVEKEKKLGEEEAMKESLVIQTQGVEKNFQSLLSEVQQQWQSASNEIASLERIAKEKMAAGNGQALLTGTDLSWPVPSKYVTCPFHDPDYPYRSWIGEHSGIDVRAGQGTPIKAPAPGYVAVAKDNGMGYSYIMIVHNDEISTVYGHVSQINVSQDQYVTRGQVIGLTGGMPGTPGAGSFSTGPHLHFEVRSNGIPVNPMNYLVN